MEIFEKYCHEPENFIEIPGLDYFTRIGISSCRRVMSQEILIFLSRDPEKRLIPSRSHIRRLDFPLFQFDITPFLSTFRNFRPIRDEKTC